MSRRRIAVIYAVLALLAGWVFLLDRPPTDPEKPAPSPPASSILESETSAVMAVTFRANDRTVRARRTDHGWIATEPAGAKIPPDLFEATVATLTAGQPAEELAQEPDSALAAYGLATPSAALEITVGDAQPITVFIGDQNPTRTAVYARRSDRPTIFLVGLNLRYYVDLVFEAAKS